MRSCLPFLAAFVPSIRRAYFPARTGSFTTVTPSLGAPFHCFVSPVSKSPRQMTSADTLVADSTRHASRMTATRRPMSFPLSPDRLQARERRGAGAELVRLDAQPLQHAHVEVAQRR